MLCTSLDKLSSQCTYKSRHWIPRVSFVRWLILRSPYSQMLVHHIHVVVRASTSDWAISLNFVQTLNFRYSFFFIISWWWITHVADELCRVPTKQSFVCVDSLLHRKSSVLSLCAPCYFYLLATSEFRSTSGYTSKFFSKLVLSASLLWCVIWPKSIKSV